MSRWSRRPRLSKTEDSSLGRSRLSFPHKRSSQWLLPLRSRRKCSHLDGVRLSESPGLDGLVDNLIASCDFESKSFALDLGINIYQVFGSL